MNLSPSIALGDKKLTNQSLPYIIAEVGVNHEGSFNKAIELIDLAKEGGADGVKFQTYKADKIASKNSPSYWDLGKESTTSQHELFKKYDNFNESDYRSLAKHCRQINIDFLSTPFDNDCVDYLNEIMPFFKISSSDITNYPLLKKVALTRKPILLSTGASNIDEIKSSIDFLKKNGSNQIAILHCILNYPTADKNGNLGMIIGLKNEFSKHIIGYSDHTLPDENMTSLTTSYILGARIIEKHFTFNKNLKGNDHYHAMDVNDLKQFKRIISKSYELIGTKIKKEILPEEAIARKNARRSLVLKRKLKSGHKLKEEDLICKRPGNGISPIYSSKVEGMKISRDLDEDHILLWEDIF